MVYFNKENWDCQILKYNVMYRTAVFNGVSIGIGEKGFIFYPRNRPAHK